MPIELDQNNVGQVKPPKGFLTGYAAVVLYTTKVYDAFQDINVFTTLRNRPLFLSVSLSWPRRPEVPQTFSSHSASGAHCKNLQRLCKDYCIFGKNITDRRPTGLWSANLPNIHSIQVLKSDGAKCALDSLPCSLEKSWTRLLSFHSTLSS